METAKESEVKRVSNEQVMRSVDALCEAIKVVQKDITLIKQKTGFNDTPVGGPITGNCNTDKGPWKQSKPIV